MILDWETLGYAKARVIAKLDTAISENVSKLDCGRKVKSIWTFATRVSVIA